MSWGGPATGFHLRGPIPVDGDIGGHAYIGGLDLDAKKREGKLRFPICSEDRDGRRKCGKQKLILRKDERRRGKAREHDRVEVGELKSQYFTVKR